MKPTRLNKKEVVMILATIFFSLGIRVFLLFTYQPLYGNDAPSYAALAEMIRTADFTGYNGVRTPGYPLFMLVCGMNNQLIRLAQNVCGVLSIWIIYLLLRPHLSRTAALGLILFMSISIQFPFYEAIIQTESLAMVVLLGSLYFFIVPTQHRISNMAIVGILASIGALIRPHLIILPPIFLIMFTWINWSERRVLFRGVYAMAVPSILFVGSWIFLNYNLLSQVTFTTLPRNDIIAHMIHYVADADEKYGPVKSAFVDSYQTMKVAVEAADDNRSGYTMYAGKLLRERGVDLSLYPSGVVHDMAIDLIKKHPFGYLKNFVMAWSRFWRVHIIVYDENFCPDSMLYGVIMRVWFFVKVPWLLMNGIFLLLIPIFPFLQMPKHRLVFVSTLYVVLMAASGSQAMTQYYDNARFAVPFQPLVAIAVFIVWSSFLERWRGHRKTEERPETVALRPNRDAEIGALNKFEY